MVCPRLMPKQIRAQGTKYFLHSAKSANSLRGDGSLSTVSPRSETADHYVYDPSNPVPTVGGPLCCDSNHRALVLETSAQWKLATTS